MRSDTILSNVLTMLTDHLKPHCIRCSHFKVDDVSVLEASSNRSVPIVEDNVTASATYAMTLVTAWML
jgi:hypothetical protein